MLAFKAFLQGWAAMGCLACSLYFLRFWRQSRDRLFASFSLAFGALALNATLVMAFGADDELRHFIYLLRLAAFVVILHAIWEKNRGK